MIRTTRTNNHEQHERPLLKYRIDWQHDEGGPHPVFRSVVAWFQHPNGAKELANALELVSEGYKAQAVPLNEDATAAVVALGVTDALDRVAKKYEGEGWTHKELRVNRTKAAREFCVRTLISRDLGAIENELRKRFAKVYDIGCSEGDDPLPDDEPNKWPNAEGMHEWVCLLRLRSSQVTPDDLPEGVNLQWAVYWISGQDSAFEEATGKSLNEATDEEAIAYTATDNAFLELLSYELGGEQLANHCELCEDSVKWIGEPWTLHLKAAFRSQAIKAGE